MQVSFQQWGQSSFSRQFLFIHGWGMNSGVWTDVAQYLQQEYPERSIRCVDLPGYGQSAAYSREALGGQYNAQSLAQSLLPLLKGKQTSIIAWSMGGLVAIDLLEQAKTYADVIIEKLILVSSTPRFVQGDGWNDAVEARIFENFCQSLAKDHHLTLKRFLAIQALGSRTAREDIKTLQAQLLKRGEPEPKMLEYGLKMLLNEDKRLQLQQICDIPISLISGKLDTLVKFQGQKQLAHQENISLFVMPAAGHAPFISHSEAFNAILRSIL